MSEENLQRKADRVKLGTRRSVFSYMIILFLAAFILLLFAYLMQQRSNEQAIDGLKDSISSMQNAQEVYEENSTLKQQLSDLQQQTDDLIQAQKNQIDGLERSNALLINERDMLKKATQAMDWFWQINEAYVRGRITLAKELITNMKYAGLVEFLPRESITNNERFSPYDRYQEIYNALY